ncbi:Outer membrane protein transport protein domain-containing protein [Desulfonema magnum]|uniref:Outer membrane protein transport protein domain-containing protein n=2 Tax=Desulfonema magnum TaxID=45655 RepID=A0A975BVN4_9BACT|nr:Outer membrane protein transport protein domain-containing protein [Desulfonema magnum]
MKGHDMSTKKSFIIYLILLMGVFMYPTTSVFGNGVFVNLMEIPSSFNPVGSGARAIGMGGAFIAVADDATAASWNPGGLVQLTLPEFSLVTSYLHRGEEIDFGEDYPEAAGSHSVSEGDINYFSAAYPFGLFNRNMIVSLSYQRLYDLNRDWKFAFSMPERPFEDHWDYQQTGSLSALGLSYCIQVIPQLSFGFTLNLWDDDLTDNHWEQKYHLTRSAKEINASPLAFTSEKAYSFSGINANLGMLWRINYKLTLGAVLKTPFNADVEHKSQEKQASEYMPEDIVISDSRDEEIEMPMSYGIGFAYKFSDSFFMSADYYRTEWDDFIYRDNQGNETSPISGRAISESDVSPTNQIRIGAEYRFINAEKGYVIPIRGGIFYDPAPAEGNPDDFYGFSLGLGLTRNDRFSLDIAYQYRRGNDVGESMFENLQFSQDVDEHTVYLSVIFYP